MELKYLHVQNNKSDNLLLVFYFVKKDLHWHLKALILHFEFHYFESMDAHLKTKLVPSAGIKPEH